MLRLRKKAPQNVLVKFNQNELLVPYSCILYSLYWFFIVVSTNCAVIATNHLMAMFIAFLRHSVVTIVTD